MQVLALPLESDRECPELQDLLPMRPFLSVFHAKAHDFKCEIKWSGAYQEGADSTLGEEVEQCNAFLLRIAVTTKHMSKAGCIDMLTVGVILPDKSGFSNLNLRVARKARATIALQCQLHNLEAMKTEMDIIDNQLEGWIIDINEWAEATTSPNDADVAAVASRIEELVASVKRRSQRLYKDNDECKGRARIRQKIREEFCFFYSVVEKYNTLVPNAEKVTLDTILSDEIVWPWQLTHGETVDLRTKRKVFDIVMDIRRLEEEKRFLIAEMNKHWKSLCTHADTLKQMSSQLSNVTSGETWGLLQDGIQGQQSLTMKNKEASNSLAKHAKNCYAHSSLCAGSLAKRYTLLETLDSDHIFSSFRSTTPLPHGPGRASAARVTKLTPGPTRATRPARRENDKLAPIRDLWNLWVERLPLMFNPGPDITVDECLVPFQGPCSFKQYMPSKPEKYRVNRSTTGEQLICQSRYNADHIFPVTRALVKVLASGIIKESGRADSTTVNLEKGPSDVWWSRFKACHPELTSPLYIRHSLEDKPHLVFNCDETGFGDKPRSREKVLCQTGRKHVYQQQKTTREHITVHCCVSAAGESFHPSSSTPAASQATHTAWMGPPTLSMASRRRATPIHRSHYSLRHNHAYNHTRMIV
ncbi:unnamed protein product [Leuciscus chuanchicus]